MSISQLTSLITVFAAIVTIAALVIAVYPVVLKNFLRKPEADALVVPPSNQVRISKIETIEELEALASMPDHMLDEKQDEELSSLLAQEYNGIWRSLTKITEGLQQLNQFRPGTDLEFLALTNMLLFRVQQFLRVNRRTTPLSTYQVASLMIMINDTDNSINYSGEWKHETVPSGQYYQNDVTVADTVDVYFEYRFVGTGINCFNGVFPDKYGVVEIYLDDKYEGSRTISSSTTHMQQSVFQRTGLERREHTIKLVLKEGNFALDGIGTYP